MYFGAAAMRARALAAAKEALKTWDFKTSNGRGAKVVSGYWPTGQLNCNANDC
jgi:hypothetical protein